MTNPFSGQRIFLIGFMGSGKTSLGKILADRCNLPFTDMDHRVEEVAGMPVAEIFRTQGEAFFRKTEQHVLDEICHGEAAVIATGGGVPCFSDNLQRMKEAGLVIYLQCSVPELTEWLSVFKGDRPLLQGLEGLDLEQWIHTELERREPFYLQADLLVDAYHTEPSEIIRKIKELL